MAPARSVSQGRALGNSEELWTKSTANGTGIVAFGAALKREVDVSQVAVAARDLSQQHALLKARIAENTRGKLVFEAGDSDSFLPVVRERPWPCPPTQEAQLSGIVFFDRDYEDHSLSIALHNIIKDELNSPFLNADGKPSVPVDVLQVHVYKDTKKAQSVIVLRIHAGAIDRYGSSVIIQDFLTVLNCHIEGKECHFPENPGKESIISCMEDMIPKGKASKGLLQKGVDAIGYAWNSQKSAILPLNPAFTALRKEPLQSDLLSFNLGKNGTSSLLTACKSEGATPACALCAAFLKAAGDIKDSKGREFSFTGAFDCRGYVDPPLPKRAVGSYTAALLLVEKVKDNISFWDLARNVLKSIERSLEKSKHFSELSVLGLLFSQVLKHPNLTPSSSLRTGLFSLFTDDLFDARWQNIEALQLVGSLGPFSSMHFVGPCFAVGESLMEGDELHLSFIFPYPVFTREQMYSFITSALDLLASATNSY